MPETHNSLFDTYIIVDWSASNTPKTGKDSIWIGEVRRTNTRLTTLAPVNIPTRSAAMSRIESRLTKEIAQGRRVFIGFDFPFGYPAGSASILTGSTGWQPLWKMFAEKAIDDDANRSNRFQLANQWNREKFGKPVFWGRPHQHRYANLPARKPHNDIIKAYEYRIAEHWQPTAKSLWQLAYTGAVGSQAILGIARLEKLRRTFGDKLRAWPFETKWDRHLDAPVIIGEIYPSMIEPEFRGNEVKDAAQVRTMARLYAKLDRNGVFCKFLSRPEGLTAQESKTILREEGWITGAGHSIEQL